MSEYTEHIYQEYHGKTYEPINQREEIVRCRDCAKIENGWLCAWSSREVEPDCFCSWGEKREP